MDWNEERIATLTRLWQEGCSASQVARQLGDISRSAVIGKVHRLGIAGREAPARPRNVGGRPATRVQAKTTAGVSERVTTPRAPRPAVVPVVFETTASATILTLGEHACRWPIGDPGESDFGYCGLRRSGAGPYCEGHTPMAFRPRRGAAKRADVENLMRRFAGGPAEAIERYQRI